MIVDNPNPFSWDNSLWQTLLTDRTLNQPIQWATTSYETLGQGYQPTDPLLNDNVGMTDLLTVVLPRASKTDSQRKQRAQSDGEVFTPSWLCNHQNNAIDALWFQTDSPFTTEKEKDWETVQSPILWQRPNDWHDYVLADRCEIACGEAPYLVSRYDSVTGKPIPIANRIGILDRKLRVINEQHLTYDEWQAWVESAYQHTYGFDKQGDSLAIARTNLLLTYLECHDAVWHRYPSNESLHRIAEIISWNIWQMDGLTLTIPNTEISPTIKHWDDASSQSFTDDTLTYPLFDSVVGNPPYQQLDGGGKVSAKPIYPQFVQYATHWARHAASIVMPARWYTGGKGLNHFREWLLHNPTIATIDDYVMTKDIFPDVVIRGGISIVTFDQSKETLPVTMHSHTHHGEVTTATRPLADTQLPIVIRDHRAVRILEQVRHYHHGEWFSNHVSVRQPFGLRGYILNDPTLFHDSYANLADPVVCFGRHRTVGYVERQTIAKRTEWVNRWKVFLAIANGIGTELPDDNLNAFIGQPNTCCTDSYLAVIGDDISDEATAQAIVKYCATHFARFLHAQLKTSQNAARATFQTVPWLDFTDHSPIDWSQDVATIDRQLCTYYHLAEDDYVYMQQTIRPMTIRPVHVSMPPSLVKD